MSQFIFLAIMLIGQLAQPEAVSNAYFSVAQLRPLVGEPIEISLTITLKSGSIITAWPEFPTQWGEFEIETIGELTITEIGAGMVEHQQTFTARLWEPGDYETPETTITYQLPDESTSSELIVDSSYFTVPSVLTSDNEALAAPKAPVYMAYFPLWLFIIIVFLVIVGATGSINYWRLRSRRRRAIRADDIDIRVLGQRTLTLLQKIDDQSTDPAAVYTLVDDGLRTYLCDYNSTVTREMTTGELLYTIQHDLPAPLQERLQQLLSQADLVKFARVQPDHESARRYLEAAVRWMKVMVREQREHPEAAGEVA